MPSTRGDSRTDDERPRVVYVSYDGAGEPLGRSQVVAYLQRLAPNCEITLVSFEKDRASRAETRRLLSQAGIGWCALSYHKRPPVLSTLYDVVVGALAVRRAVRALDADIVHVRSYVPALIGLLAAWPRKRRWRLLFDIRGFWADERVISGAWPPASRLYRLTKRCEQWFFSEADAVVTLTAASVPQIRSWLGKRDVPVVVIPTCADVERYGGSEPRPDGPHAVWCGSLDTCYRFDLGVRFASVLGLPFTVLTRQLESAHSQLGEVDADVRKVAHDDVAAELRPGDIGICFLAASFADLARAPTRIAEHLAAGMVIAVTPGIGDYDAIVQNDQIGVIVTDETDAALAQAAGRALASASNPDVQGRARQLARELYSVVDGVNAYLELYRGLRQGSSAADIGFETRLRRGAGPTGAPPSTTP